MHNCALFISIESLVVDEFIYLTVFLYQQQWLDFRIYEIMSIMLFDKPILCPLSGPARSSTRHSDSVQLGPCAAASSHAGAEGWEVIA